MVEGEKWMGNGSKVVNIGLWDLVPVIETSNDGTVMTLPINGYNDAELLFAKWSVHRNVKGIC
jgi:hypothetical protein